MIFDLQISKERVDNCSHCKITVPHCVLKAIKWNEDDDVLKPLLYTVNISGTTEEAYFTFPIGIL